MRRLFITIIAVLFLLSILLCQPLTLDECIRLAAQQNYQVLAAQESLSISLSQRYQAVTTLLPSASATAAYTRLDKAPYAEFDPSAMLPEGSPPQDQIQVEMGKAEMEKTEIQVMQPIAAQLFTAVSLANSGVQHKEITLLKSRLTSALSAEKAFFQYMQASAFIEIANVSKSQIDAHITDLQNMYDQGILHKKDLLKAQVQSSEMELLVLQAQNAQQITRSALAMTIGYSQDAQIIVTESLEYIEYPHSLDSVLAWAQRSAIDLRLLHIGLDASDKQVTLAWEGLLPSFAAIFNYDYQKPNRSLENEWYSSWTAVGAFQWDVFNWGANVSKIKQANAQMRQMGFIHKGALDGISLQARAAYLTMDERRKKLDVARKELETTQENFRVTTDLFQAGAATNSELLDAHSDLTRAKINFNTYLADYNIARAEVEMLTGQLEAKVNKLITEENKNE